MLKNISKEKFMNRYIVVVLILIGLLLLLINPVSARVSQQTETEQEADSACFSLDVIFIIDQSDSMSEVGGFIPNDPTEQRAYAPRWAIDWLADNAYDICADSVHRAAVISFGTEAVVDLEMSEIAPNDIDDYQRIRSRLKENISARDMGQTDPKKAFEMAVQMLDDAGPLPFGGPRKRVIIFMTDGEPCVAGLGCRPPGENTMNFIQYAQEMRDYVKENLNFDSTLLEQERCLKDVREEYEGDEIPPEEINNCLEEYRLEPDEYENSVYLWTMLLRKGTDYSRILREIYAGMAEEHGGELIDLRENRQDIPATFLDILSRLAGVKATRLSCDNFAVNPYLRQARLVFFKISEDTTVNLLYTNASGEVCELQGATSGACFDVDQANSYSEGTNQRITINTPYPGIWAVESDSCEGIDAYYEELQFDISGLQPLAILTPDGDAISPEASYGVEPITKFGQEPYYDVDNPYYLQYILRDIEGSTIDNAESPFFGVQFDVQVTGPDGNASSYEMAWVESDGLFRSASPLMLPLQGEYQVSVQGDTVHRNYPYGPIDRSQTQEDVFNDIRHLFDYQSKFNVVCPGLDLVERCPWETHVSEDGCSVCPLKNFGVTLLSPGEGPIGPVHETISGGWPLEIKPVPFQFQIEGAQGEDLNLDEILSNPARPVRVMVSAGGVEREVAYVRDGSATNTYTGSIEEVEAEGPYQLSVILTSDYNEFYRPSNETARREFSRADGPWNRASTYLTLLYIIIAAILALIIYNILIRTNRVRGALVFTHYDGEEIASFSLNSDKNWKVIGSRTLNNYPQLDLKRIRATNAGRAARKKGAEEDVLESIEGFSTSSQPGVRVQFTPRKGGRFSENLPPNQPVPYSPYGAENLFQVEYRRD